MSECTPAAFQNQSISHLADLLKAIGHPVRLEIVSRLVHRKKSCCSEMCECFTLSQSTVSQHISVLKEAGVIIAGKDGNKSSYALNHDILDQFRKELDLLLDHTKGCCHD